MKIKPYSKMATLSKKNQPQKSCVSRIWAGTYKYNLGSNYIMNHMGHMGVYAP